MTCIVAGSSQTATDKWDDGSVRSAQRWGLAADLFGASYTFSTFSHQAVVRGGVGVAVPRHFNCPVNCEGSLLVVSEKS